MGSMHQQLMARVMSAPMGTRAMGTSGKPSSLAGLVAWGEGSDLGADGTAISSWLNKTGSGLDPAQTTAGNKPTVKANAINGQKAALFTSANSQHLDFPAGALGWFNGAPGCVLAAVVQPLTFAASMTPLQAATNAGDQRAVLFLNKPSNNFLIKVKRPDSVAALASGGSIVAGTPYITLLTADVVNGPIVANLNGAVAGSGSIVTPGLFDATNSTSITLGSNGVPASFMDGYIAAYAMWNVAYTRSQLADVLLRWSQLYNIPLTG